MQYILLTECNSGAIQKLLFGTNTMIELNNITATYDNTSTLVI